MASPFPLLGRMLLLLLLRCIRRGLAVVRDHLARFGLDGSILSRQGGIRGGSGETRGLCAPTIPTAELGRPPWRVVTTEFAVWKMAAVIKRGERVEQARPDSGDEV